MKRVWITGYRSYELQIFDPKSDKALIIKETLKNEMRSLIENGCDWFLTGLQLGIEQWSIEIANELKEEFPNEFKIAILTPFNGFGSQWNEENKIRMNSLINLGDYYNKVSDKDYESPKQLKNYQSFMVNHTDSALLVYDDEHEGKTKYDYEFINRYQDNHNYSLQLIDFEDLQEGAEIYEEKTKLNRNYDF
ncbi:DUF1273 domain-containing protein [Fructilactobacillus vespulae]|uniref:DUF1273 domain-containing protein n=1 Tax=Fructilactobacillus vespulae TaxID=1249630 RepID=UPI0039B60E5A